MSITDQVLKTIDSESKKHRQDREFAQTLSTIDDLKRKGILSPPRYKLPLSDTIGRRLSEPQRPDSDAGR